MKMFCKLKNKLAFVSFLILMMTFGLFFGCSNLYQSKETVSLTFNFSFSRSEPQNEKVLKVDLISKNGKKLQHIEKNFFNETVDIKFSNVLVNSEIYISASPRITSVKNCLTASAITDSLQTTGSVSFSKSRFKDIIPLSFFVFTGYNSSLLPCTLSVTPKTLGIEVTVISASKIAVLYPFFVH